MKDGTNMAAKWKDILQICPNRGKQARELLDLIGRVGEPTPQNILIYGHNATGKRHTVMSIMTLLDLLYVSVDCRYCTSSRMLFELILNSVAGYKVNKNEDYEPIIRCDNMADFVWYLKELIIGRQLKKETFFLILDKCEYMKKLGSNLFPAFTRLQELSKLNVCVVFLTDGVPEHLYPRSGVSEPIQVFFPQYSEDEIKQVLFLIRPFPCEEILYVNYLNILVGSFYKMCRNLRELEYMVLENFEKYCEPIASDSLRSNDGYLLWQRFLPHLKMLLQNAFLRESVRECKTSTEKSAFSVGDPSSIVAMPLYTKFLLIAAYLASYNPSKMDKCLFLKASNKKSKSLLKKKNKMNNHVLGPKPFSLDRLLSIFYSILDQNVPLLRANVMSQISSLVTLHYLAVVGEDILGKPAYKCSFGLNFIRQVSSSVNFNIVKYLYDFM